MIGSRVKKKEKKKKIVWHGLPDSPSYTDISVNLEILIRDFPSTFSVSLRFADFRENWKRTGGGDVSGRPRFAAKQRRTTARRRRRQSNDAVKNIDPNRAAIVREIIIEITNASFFSTLATFESSIEPSNDKIKQFATSISMERCRDIGRETSS